MGTIGRERAGAHGPAKPSDRVLRILALNAATANHRRHGQPSLAEFDPVSTIGYIQPQRHALLIKLPEAQCSRIRLYSVTMTSRAIMSGEIPWHHALRNQVAPAQLSITALPCIAQRTQVGLHLRLPPHMHHGNFGRPRSHRQHQRIRLHRAFHRNPASSPLRAGFCSRICPAGNVRSKPAYTVTPSGTRSKSRNEGPPLREAGFAGRNYGQIRQPRPRPRAEMNGGLVRSFFMIATQT